MNSDEIARLRVLHEEATPAPWTGIDGGLLCHDGYLARFFARFMGFEQAAADAELIAAARNALPALLNAAERLEEIEERQDLSDLECAYAMAMRERDEARALLAEAEAQAAAMREILTSLVEDCDHARYQDVRLDYIEVQHDREDISAVRACLSGSAGRALLEHVAKMEAALRNLHAWRHQIGQASIGMEWMDGVQAALLAVEEALR